jgi:hypothetical protein
MFLNETCTFVRNLSTIASLVKKKFRSPKFVKKSFVLRSLQLRGSNRGKNKIPATTQNEI